VIKKLFCLRMRGGRCCSPRPRGTPFIPPRLVANLLHRKNLPRRQQTRRPRSAARLAPGAIGRRERHHIPRGAGSLRAPIARRGRTIERFRFGGGGEREQHGGRCRVSGAAQRGSRALPASTPALAPSHHQVALEFDHPQCSIGSLEAAGEGLRRIRKSKKKDLLFSRVGCAAASSRAPPMTRR
jgi:hypothetical protein